MPKVARRARTVSLNWQRRELSDLRLRNIRTCKNETARPLNGRAAVGRVLDTCLRGMVAECERATMAVAGSARSAMKGELRNKKPRPFEDASAIGSQKPNSNGRGNKSLFCFRVAFRDQ